MKKMSIVTALIMLVTITTYSVSGTYAKYTSSVDLTDEARVAKWSLTGVDNCAQDEHGNYTCSKATKLNLFADSYSYENGLYVKSLDRDNVVAPGTKGEYQLNLSGTMEVRHTIDIDFSAEKEIAVSYNVDADGKIAKNADGTYQIYNDLTSGSHIYRPMTYTVNFFEGSNSYINVTSNDLADLQNKINTANTMEFEPAKRLLYSIRISWAWNAENNVDGLADGQVDVLDTYIGENLAPWINSAHDVQDIGGNAQYKLAVTATQVAEDHATNEKTTIK